MHKDSLLKVTFSASSGVCLGFPAATVWVDFAHQLKGLHSSCVDDEEWELIKKLNELKPDVMLYTHRHPDHFTMRLARESMLLYPDVPLLAPHCWSRMAEDDFYCSEAGDIGIEVSGKHAQFSFDTASCGQVTVIYDETTHSGADYAGTPHYSVTVCSDDIKVFFSADARLCDSSVKDIIDREKPDAAFFTFPWLLIEEGRKFITESGIKNIVIYHIPFEKDDDLHFRKSIEKSKHLPDIPDVRLLLHPLQKEIIKI